MAALLLRAGHVARRTAKLTLNYGLRLDVINPQTVNEAGNGGFLDLDTGEINVAGVGDIDLNGDVENTLNWAPRVGATYQLDEKTVLRGGYGRSYDIGVFGSLFGHSVTQNLPVLVGAGAERAVELRPRVHARARGRRAPVFPDVPSNGRFPLPNGVFARALPEKQRPPRVDAFNVTVQRQLTDDDVGRGRLRRQPRRQRVRRRRPGVNINQATLNGFPQGVPLEQPPAVLQRVRLDAGHRLLLQLRRQLVRLAAGEVQPSGSRTATRSR